MPVHIDNLNRVLPRGEFLPVPLLSCISFGPPMWLEAGEPKTEFLKRAREAVRRLKDCDRDPVIMDYKTLGWSAACWPS